MSSDSFCWLYMVSIFSICYSNDATGLEWKKRIGYTNEMAFTTLWFFCKTSKIMNSDQDKCGIQSRNQTGIEKLNHWIKETHITTLSHCASLCPVHRPPAHVTRLAALVGCGPTQPAQSAQSAQTRRTRLNSGTGSATADPGERRRGVIGGKLLTSGNHNTNNTEKTSAQYILNI